MAKPVPTGTVQLAIDGINNGSPLTLDGSGNIQGNIDISSLTPGGHQLQANYSGDSNYPPAGGSVNFQAGDGTATVTVTAAVNGSTLSFTVNVAPSQP